jgi:hypothetical protein
MAADGAPERYLDGWARLQLQRPIGMDELRWRRAIDDAGLFLDRWGALADAFGWTLGDLMDVPCDGKPGGLVWFLEGEAVVSLGPDRAVTAADRQTLSRAKLKLLREGKLVEKDELI